MIRFSSARTHLRHRWLWPPIFQISRQQKPVPTFGALIQRIALNRLHQPDSGHFCLHRSQPPATPSRIRKCSNCAPAAKPFKIDSNANCLFHSPLMNSVIFSAFFLLRRRLYSRPLLFSPAPQSFPFGSSIIRFLTIAVARLRLKPQSTSSVAPIPRSLTAAALREPHRIHGDRVRVAAVRVAHDGAQFRDGASNTPRSG